jgi:glycosyltransferase involved in cell wall biosynthesis
MSVVSAGKVCHIVDTLNPGGLERTLVAIALGTSGFEHHVWCLKDLGLLSQELVTADVPVRAFGFQGGLKSSSLSRLAAALRGERFSIAHCHGLFPSIWGRPAAFLAGVPVRLAHCQNLYYGISMKQRLKLRFLAGMTARCIAVSAAVRECLVSFVGIHPSKVEIIYNSASDVSVDPQTRARLRREFGCSDDDVLICSAGRLCVHKGHRYLIEAFRNMSNNQRVRLVIVGDGDRRDDLRTRIRALGEGRAYLAGYRQDCPEIIAASDIYVQPSLEREGLPLVLAEAAAAGRALVATDVGGNSEIVNEGVNGFLVRQADANGVARVLERLVNDDALRTRMGQASRETWQRTFTREAMLKSMGGLYRRLLGA